MICTLWDTTFLYRTEPFCTGQKLSVPDRTFLYRTKRNLCDELLSHVSVSTHDNVYLCTWVHVHCVHTVATIIYPFLYFLFDGPR